MSFVLVRTPMRQTSALVFALCALVAAIACGGDDTAPADPSLPGGNQPGADGGGADGDTVGGPVVAEVGLDVRPLNSTCKAPGRPPPAAGAQLVRVWDTLTTTRPMGLAQPPGDKTRWVMANRSGIFSTFSATNPTGTPTQIASVPALSGKPVLEDFEGGFLGFAFHPKWAQNGRIYVSFTTSGDSGGLASEVGYITSTDNGASFTSYTRVLAFSRPKLEHNGGGIAFGKDGYLYLSFGDGALDGQYGQVKETFFGKVLRIDVDNVPGGKTYGIPPTNPFANGGGEPATFAWGFRNPYRISIDRETGELWLGDVGDNQYEEVNRVALGGNYGWPCREGFHDTPYTTNPQKCPSKAGLIDPLVEHQHPTPNSRSVTGGIVYRGSAIPGFQGTYVYSDFIQLELRALTFDPVTLEAKSEVLNGNGPQAGFSSFTEDADGEIYALALFQDSIFKLVPTAIGPAPAIPFPETLSKTGCVDPADPKKPAPGLIPYGVNAPLWSDGAEKERWFALPEGATIATKPDGDLDLPVGSVVVKTFSLGGKRVETRLLVRHDDGEWAGYTYEWNEEQTDAVLLPGGKTRQVGGQTWTYPSRIDCVRCHTVAAGRTLGLELAQLNGDTVYPSTNRRSNQLKTLDHIGIFSAPLGKPPAELPSLPNPTADGPLEARARAYLHSNCSNCHRPSGGAARSTMDLRFTTAPADTKTCNAPSAIDDDLGVAGAKLVVPGQPAQSILSLRMHAIGANKMPPLGRSLEDPATSAVIDGWIKGLTACP